MIPWWLLAWAIPASVFGFYLIWRTSGRDLPFETQSNTHLGAIVVMSFLWPIFIPRILAKRIK